jgi:hypothetical protein
MQALLALTQWVVDWVMIGWASPGASKSSQLVESGRYGGNVVPMDTSNTGRYLQHI